ncbi:MAG: T9SS type A sorting domain-containing protein, partial [Flavobacteriales bacterium]|nr:T9SS type A sorting domain-containing protein [Flavobacteriales bacterium]
GAIYLGTHARGIWRSDNLLSIDDDEITNEPVLSLDNLYVYPNPVVNEAKLSFELNHNSGVKASVYDLNGRIVDVVSNQNRNAGSHTISFNVSNYQVGTYFVVLETNNNKKVVKFIKY